MDVQEQLAQLRKRIALIDRKYARATPAAATPTEHPFSLRPARYFVEELISGKVVATSAGEHFETEKLYERHRRHGSMDISSLIELPSDLLDSLRRNHPASHPKALGFSRTRRQRAWRARRRDVCVPGGRGEHRRRGFRVRQFFMRDFGDEPSLLAGLAEYLSNFDADHPTASHTISRCSNPLQDGRAPLPLRACAPGPVTARGGSGSCVSIAAGWSTSGPDPGPGARRRPTGEMIPYYYFQYGACTRPSSLSIFHHNVMDIVSLACLTAVVPFAFRSRRMPPCGMERIWWVWRDGWRRLNDTRKPCGCSAAPWPGTCELLFKTQWEIGRLEKLEAVPAALAIYTDLAAAKNPYRAGAFEG